MNESEKETPAVEDQDKIKVDVVSRDGLVVLAFDKPTQWVNMSPKQARQLAERLRKASYVER